MDFASFKMCKSFFKLLLLIGIIYFFASFILQFTDAGHFSTAFGKVEHRLRLFRVV